MYTTLFLALALIAHSFCYSPSTS